MVMIDLNSKINKDLAAIDRQIKQAATERDESATPMESHSDQTRQIANQLYNSLLEEKQKLLELKSVIAKYNLVWHIQNLSDKATRKYFVVPNGFGGTMLEDVMLLSEKTPLAKKISGMKVGYEFDLNGQMFRIEKVEENVRGIVNI